MNILVIGSQGFIGSHCYQYFSQKQKTWQADVVPGYGLSNYYRVDATDSSYDNLFKQHQFDVCINCSGAANVQESLANPALDYSLNTFNVHKILDAIRKDCPTCKFINLSSAAVYGNPVSLPVKETQICKPLSPYGFHKYQADILCQEYYKLFSVPTCVLRIFSAYGPGLKKQLFWDLHQKSNHQNNITLYGSGNESRDFIFIDDIVSAIEVIIKSDVFNGMPINLAGGKEIFIKDAVQIFFKYLQWQGDYQFNQENRAGDPVNWEADISFIKNLGFQPRVDLEEGLKKYTKWLKSIK